MSKFYPNMYKKDIFDINYDKLKKIGIKLLIFDLDNTIGLLDQDYIDVRTKTLFNKLQSEFKIVIISNNINKNRVKRYASKLDCDYIYCAMKPLLRGYRKVRNRYNISGNKMCMIGDQLVTDVFAGNRFKTYTVLVDPLGTKDLKITGINRRIENKIIKKFERKKIFKKGDYYE